MSAYFTDPDGDALTFTAASAHAGVVSVEIAGSTVTIAGVAPGTTVVTVTATDPGGISAQQTVAITVPNRGPVAVGTISGQSVESGQTVAVDVSPFFSDPDGEALTYTATSSNSGVTTATLDGSFGDDSRRGSGDRDDHRHGHGPGRTQRSAAFRGDRHGRPVRYPPDCVSHSRPDADGGRITRMEGAATTSATPTAIR